MDGAATPNLDRLFGSLTSIWPEHHRHLDRVRGEMESDELPDADEAAAHVLAIAGDRLEEICGDYRFLCEQMFQEQLHFARKRRYRLTTFAEAQAEVYDNPLFMRRYLHGLLVGRVAWLDQLRMWAMFRRDFLPGNDADYRHLEVGPGHGMLLHLAADDDRCAEVAALDVSTSSLEVTAITISRLGARRAPELILHDLLADAPPDERRWDSVVVSEVLEHLEQPEAALQRLRDLLEPGGRIFVTTPVNSPMPDHIHLFESPEQVTEMVSESGLEVLVERRFTGAGLTEERARLRHLPISCALIAQRPRSDAVG